MNAQLYTLYLQYGLQEGDLIAFLDGEPRPNVVSAIKESPDLYAELQRLEELDTWLDKSFGGNRVNPQAFVDVMTGQASQQDLDMVARYIFVSDSARKEFHSLLKAYRALPSVFITDHWTGSKITLSVLRVVLNRREQARRRITRTNSRRR